MLLLGAEAVDGCRLDDTPVLHHGDPVRDVEQQRQVMRNEQHGKAHALLQGLHRCEEILLDNDVERGGRLVENDQRAGFQCQRHGDHHALLLAAGKLVRKGAAPSRIDIDHFKQAR